ncbi:MAG: hypothetical protein QFX36_04085 [Archaeoglobales archaeon]|nr:hypothetical protein [Archaeoglobales archaeon]
MILIVKTDSIKLLDLEKAEAIEFKKVQNKYLMDIFYQNGVFSEKLDIEDSHAEVLTQYFSIMKNKEAIEDLQKLLEKLR